MKIYHFLFLVGVLLAAGFSSCEKIENELEDVTLYNPYDSLSGLEIMQIDSMQRIYGAPNALKGYFHINSQYVPDTSVVQRVILYRNGAEKGRLSPGNISFFVDITALPGASYNYQMQLLMKDSSYTKLTIPYVITF
jgi:hypothetical protein